MPKPVDHDEIRKLLRTGKAQALVARKVGCSVDTVRRVRREMEETGDDGGGAATAEHPGVEDYDAVFGHGRDDYGVREARAARVKKEEEARQLEAEAKIARARRELAELEHRRDREPARTDWTAVAREIAPVLRPPAAAEPRGNDTSRLLLELMQRQIEAAERRLEQQQEQMRQMVEAAAQHQAPASDKPLKNPLADAVSQIQVLSELLELTDRFRRERGDDDGGGILGRLAEQLLTQRLGGEAQRPPAPGPKPNGTVQHPPAPTTDDQAPPPPTGDTDPMADIDAQKRDRVRMFVSAIAQECVLGSDPETVAQSESGQDLVGMLPGEVRAALLGGDWSRAWAVCEQIDPEGCRRIAPHLQSEGIQTWLSSYAGSLSEPEDGFDAAEQAG